MPLLAPSRCIAAVVWTVSSCFSTTSQGSGSLIPGSTLGNVSTLDAELTETQTLGDVKYARYLGDVQNALAGGLTAETLLSESLKKRFSEHLEGKNARKSHQIFQAIMGFDPAVQAKCLDCQWQAGSVTAMIAQPEAGCASKAQSLTR